MFKNNTTSSTLANEAKNIYQAHAYLYAKTEATVNTHQ
jgi:hypothetical protein